MKRTRYRTESKHTFRKVTLTVILAVTAFFAGLMAAYPLRWLFDMVSGFFG